MALVFVLNGGINFLPYIGFNSLGGIRAWVALAIHDTALKSQRQLYGEESAAVATTVKLGRTFLVPLAFVVALIFRSKAKFETPWFVLGFILAALVGTLVSVPLIFKGL